MSVLQFEIPKIFIVQNAIIGCVLIDSLFSSPIPFVFEALHILSVLLLMSFLSRVIVDVSLTFVHSIFYYYLILDSFILCV